jgi:uncharacterized membrane protein YvbJ
MCIHTCYYVSDFGIRHTTSPRPIAVRKKTHILFLSVLIIIIIIIIIIFLDPNFSTHMNMNE